MTVHHPSSGRIAPGRRLLLAASLLACAARAAGAQQPATPDSTPRYGIDTLQVTVLRTRIAPLRAPFAISIIPVAEENRGRPGLALNEALLAVPGVQVDNRFNYALGERISIRGMGARAQFGVRGVRILLDGLPATLPDGQTQLNHVDPAALTRVEVLRGPAAALYGNASAGVVRLSTLDATSLSFAPRYQVSAGSDGLLRMRSSAAGAHGPGSWNASLSRLRYHGYRQHQSADNYVAGVRAGTRVGANDLWLAGSGVHYHAQNPGALSDSMLAADREQAVPANVTQQAGERGRQAQLGAGWSRTLSALRSELSVHGLLRSLQNPIPIRYIDLRRSSGGARGTLAGALGEALSLSGGAEWELQRDHRLNHANQQGERGALLLDQKERVTALGIFAEAALRAGPARVVGALRRDRFRFSVADQLVTPADPDDSGARTLAAWSPALGASLAAAPWLALYGNYSTSFQTPTTSELANQASGAGGFNPDLGPERSHALELGIKARGARTWLELAAFRARVDSMLIGYEVPGFAGRQFYRNAGQAVHRGVELGAGGSPLPGMTLRGAFTWTDARFRRYQVGGNDFAGNRVPGIAPRRLEASASWQPAGGAFLAAEVLAQGATPVADDPTAGSPPSPSYVLAGARAGWRPLAAGRLRLAPTLGVTNLFAARYNASVVVNAARGRFYEPGPGRALHLALDLSAAPR